jgi:hypothetical protein
VLISECDLSISQNPHCENNQEHAGKEKVKRRRGLHCESIHDSPYDGTGDSTGDSAGDSTNDANETGIG